MASHEIRENPWKSCYFSKFAHFDVKNNFWHHNLFSWLSLKMIIQQRETIFHAFDLPSIHLIDSFNRVLLLRSETRFIIAFITWHPCNWLISFFFIRDKNSIIFSVSKDASIWQYTHKLKLIKISPTKKIVW